MDEHDQCRLLENFEFIRNLTALSLRRNRGKYLDSFSFYYYTTKLNTVGSFARGRVQKEFHLDGINLTPAVVAALGRSLPEMSSLQTLRLTGDGSTLQAKEMEALFGGFNKTLPLRKLIFIGFSVTGCLAPVTKRFRFFPNLVAFVSNKINYGRS